MNPKVSFYRNRLMHTHTQIEKQASKDRTDEKQLNKTFTHYIQYQEFTLKILI